MATSEITCPSCGQASPAGKKFCGECGSPLPVICPSCGAESSPGKKFCGECGSPLGAAPAPSPPPTPAPPPVPAPVAPSPPPAVSELKERRLATLLFSDIKGSTVLGEMLDPEEVDEIVGAAQDALSDTVRSYGGHVVKLLGDGLLACFGAPIAREDDPERAVLAGLAMQRVLAELDLPMPRGAPKLQLRVGITTGEVVAGIMGGSYDVTGDAANTAARLQSAADVGGVLVGEETMRATIRRIRYGDRLDLELKGKAGLVPGYHALGPRERVAERWEVTGERTPFVGRERELHELLEAWEGVRAGDTAVVGLVGEAGAGKSRLLAEALTRIRDDAQDAGTTVAVLRGRCLSYSTEISLALVADIVRTMCGVHESTPAEETRAALDHRIERLLASGRADERAIAADVLGTLLGLRPIDSPVSGAGPQIRRRAMTTSLRLLLEAHGRHGPVALVLEDLHWIDASSREVLAELLTDVQGRALFVLATYRTGWDAPWATWEHAAEILLAPLSGHASRQLLAAVLGGKSLSQSLVRRLEERAGGNPFFLEELARSLRESGSLVDDEDGDLTLRPGLEEQLPTRLTDVLMARLDRLEPSARSTAQTGSVIGRSFPVRVLSAVSALTDSDLDTPLSALVGADIAWPRHEGEPEYVFRHATLAETAYGTLLLRRRRELHAKTAQAMCSLYDQNEHVETIAYHWSRTDEHFECACWMERAGDRAASIYANADAVARYTEARDRLIRLGEAEHVADLARLDEKLGSVLKTMGRYEQALETLERAVRSYSAVGDREGEWRAVADIGRVHRLRATPGEGIERITAVLSTVGTEKPSSGLAALYVSLARLYYPASRHEEQLDAATRASELARLAGDARLHAEAETNRGIALTKLDRNNELEVLEGAIALSETVGDLDSLQVALNNAALRYLDAGDIERCRAYRERVVTIAERMGDQAMIAWALSGLGQPLQMLGQWGEARDYFERASVLARRAGKAFFAAYPLIFLGKFCIAVGDTAQAADVLDEAMSIGIQAGFKDVIRYGRCLLAEQHLVAGEAAQAIALFDGMFDGPPETEADVSYLLPTLAWALLASGDPTRASIVADEALLRCREEPNFTDLPDALRIAAMVSSSLGAWQRAESLFSETVSECERLSNPYALARALYERGRCLAERGECDAGATDLRAALPIFERLGARPYIALTHAALEGLEPALA